jgi:pimeloyl-ACP methyl ester carboxylesterase
MASPCSIFLVHGTWGRGFFPKHRERSQRKNKRWFWFEEGSQFRTGLVAALKSESLDWPIRSFLWSGANSVHARDCAARKLSDQLREELQDNPDARAVIIAHSHGGNVALRALQFLDSMAGRIRIVTLATPFLRVVARRPFEVPLPVKNVLWFLSTYIAVYAEAAILWVVFPPVDANMGEGLFGWLQFPVFYFTAVHLTGLWLYPVLLPAAVAGVFITRWFIAIFTNRHAALAIEEEASYDTKSAAAPPMLVIRGVDDEASLALATGSIGSRLSYVVLVKLIPYIVSTLMNFSFFGLIVALSGTLGSKIFLVVFFGALLSGIVLFVLPGVFKSVFFGQEFLANGLICDIAVDSVPDTSGQVEAITLVPVGFESQVSWFPERLFSRQSWRSWWAQSQAEGEAYQLSQQPRHGIYNHPACVDEIVRWLRRTT